MQNIYVNFKIPKDLKSFMVLFLGLGTKHPNYYWSTHYAAPTFKNAECTINQCTAGRARSIEDLYLCARTYYPDVTLKEVMEVLLKLRPKGNFVYPSYCHTICRSVIGFSSHKLGHLRVRVTKNPYLWGSALNLLGIKTAKDFYNYIES